MEVNNRIGLCLLVLTVVISGCVDAEPSTPDETVENYFSDLNGFAEDTESAYDYLSSDVQDETSYADYHEEITMMKSSYESQGVSFDLLQVETTEESEGSATVEIVYTMEMLQGGATNVDREVDLVKEDDSWKIDELFNPYNLD